MKCFLKIVIGARLIFPGVGMAKLEMCIVLYPNSVPGLEYKVVRPVGVKNNS